jgi:glutamyl-tRNA reductase
MAASGRLVAVGLSHHTAPVEVRERVSMDETAVRRTLERLRSQRVVDEAMLLSTCNRMELYGTVRDEEGLRAFFGEFRGPEGERIDPYLYWYRDREAVYHLFKVASSLDSLVLGEPQILGQVKEAVRLAEQETSLGRVLHPLARRTLSVAKRVRSETDIGKSRVGIGNAGVDLAMQIFGSLHGKRAMLVGVGEMGRQVAQALVTAGLEELLVANRTFERSVEFAEATGATPVPYERLEDYLARADIVLAATGAQQPIITADMVRRSLRQRRYHTVFLIDLSVPRNIDAAVDDLEEAYLFNIDDLSKVVEEGRQLRAQAAEAAHQMVSEEADRFLESLRTVDVNDDLRKLMTTAEALRVAELERSTKLTRTLDAKQLKSLDALTKALVKKLLHRHTMAIREAARAGDLERVTTLLEPWKEEE